MSNLLRKSTMLFSGAAALGLIAASTLTWKPMFEQADQNATAQQQPEEIIFHGSVEESGNWGQSVKYGVYKFVLSNEDEPSGDGPQASFKSTGGGFYYDGKYYSLAIGQNNKGMTNNFQVHNAETWELISSHWYSSPTLTDADCMCYDYISGKAYAAGRNYADTENPYELRTINLENGEMANVGRMPVTFASMAADSDGVLWGINRQERFPYTARLYRIDKNTAECTLIGELGYNQRSIMGAATFDHRNNKLYWTSRTMTYDQYYQETYQSLVCEIDRTTGKATPVRTMPYSEVFSSLYIIDSHPKAPEAVKDGRFDYTEGSITEGTVTCTLPTACYDRSTLAGPLKIEVYAGDQLMTTKENLQPGATVTTDKITLPEGKQTLRVICYNAHKSLPSKIVVYGGADVPAAVGNLTMTATPHGDEATITWTAPTEGKNGGYLDPASVTYKVVRAPEGKVVAEGLKECTFTDKLDRYQYLSQYNVYAVNEAGESPRAYTKATILGLPHDIPYLQTFDTANDFYSYTVLDPEGKGGPEGNRFMWHPDFRVAMYWIDYNRVHMPINAWLITPALNLKPNYLYRVSFTTKGYSTEPGTKHLELTVGEFPTEASLTNVFHKEDLLQPKNTENTITGMFMANEGDMHIGIHATGNGYDHISVDNLRVQEYGPATLPAAPELVSISKADGKVYVTVKAPTRNAMGQPINDVKSIRMYSGDMKRLIDLQNVEGETITLVDSRPQFGINDYILMARNAEGNGLELACSINMKPDVPKAVENFSVATISDGHDAELKWNYPADMLGVDGNVLDPEEITYDIYRNVGYNRELITSVTGETEVVLNDVLAPYANERQKYLTYEVVARTLGGSAAGVKATGLFGPAYEMPLREVFAYNEMITPWDNSNSVNASFQAATNTGYDPRCTASEGRLLTFSPSYDSSCLGIYVSPRINLTGLLNPKFSFTVFRSPDANLENATVQIGVLPEKNGVAQKIEYIPGTFKIQADEEGWETYTVDLSAYAECERASIVFRCINNKRKGCIHFDKFELTGDKPQYDARAVRLTGPDVAVMGRENVFFAVVDNNGLNDLESVNVSLKADNEVIETKTIYLSEGESQTVAFNYVPGLHEAARPVHLYAIVEADGDANRFNNTADKRIRVEAPNLPYVTDLEAYCEGNQVHLTWGDASLYPNEVPITENFDSYDNFIINNIGGWTVHDLDGAITMLGINSSLGNLTWNNAGLPQAYIVFNPKVVGVTALCNAHSGDRCLVSFESAAPEGNNDWLVTPALSGHEQVLSFYARAMYDAFPEKFSIMISRSGTDPDDFTPLSEDYIVGHSSWERYSFTLPAGTRHAAIVCQTQGGFGFMLDDIDYVPAQPEVELTGYNVYRDGQSLIQGLGENEHHDTIDNPDGTYTYHVTATYTDGESIFSNAVQVQPSAIFNPTASKNAPSIFAIGNSIVVKAAAGAPVSVTTLDGRCIYRFNCTGTEAMSVAPGVYIVRAGDATAKLIVK